MIRTEVDLDNANGRLLPGYYGDRTVHLEEQPANPVIPSSALQSDAEGRFVLVVDGGAVHRRGVTVNFRDGSMAGIASGLSGGESVIRSSGGQLSEGQSVTATSADWSPQKQALCDSSNSTVAAFARTRVPRTLASAATRPSNRTSPISTGLPRQGIRLFHRFKPQLPHQNRCLDQPHSPPPAPPTGRLKRMRSSRPE